MALSDPSRAATRQHIRSGPRFSVYCFGSSAGLIAVVVLAQKLLPSHPALDVPLALVIVALGVAVTAT